MGCPPPVCLRCSPGLFRHGSGAAPCHTSSMAANPHLALTQNSSPTTLANRWRAAQIAGSRGQRPRSPAAAGEIPHCPQRHPQMAQSPRHMPQGRRPHPIAGGGRRPSCCGTMYGCSVGQVSALHAQTTARRTIGYSPLTNPPCLCILNI